MASAQVVKPSDLHQLIKYVAVSTSYYLLRVLLISFEATTSATTSSVPLVIIIIIFVVAIRIIVAVAFASAFINASLDFEAYQIPSTAILASSSSSSAFTFRAYHQIG